MNAKEIEEIVKNAKDKPNSVLIEARNGLKDEFEKTKELVISLTRHMDMVMESYEILNTEIGERTK